MKHTPKGRPKPVKHGRGGRRTQFRGAVTTSCVSTCTCGWKSERYSTLAQADAERQRHWDAEGAVVV